MQYDSHCRANSGVEVTSDNQHRSLPRRMGRRNNARTPNHLSIQTAPPDVRIEAWSVRPTPVRADDGRILAMDPIPGLDAIERARRWLAEQESPVLSPAYLASIARAEHLPGNGSGADKTWVERAMREFFRHYALSRQAEPR